MESCKVVLPFKPVDEILIQYETFSNESSSEGILHGTIIFIEYVVLVN